MIKKNGDSIFYKDEKIKGKTPYKDDLPHGKEILFNDDGTINTETHYEKGKKTFKKMYYTGQHTEIPLKGDQQNGVVKHYVGDVLTQEIPYENDQKNGVEIRRWNDGSMRSKTTYENNKRNGRHEDYVNGKLNLETTFVNDEENGIRKTYTKDGIISSEIKKGKKNGKREVFDNSGTLIKTAFYKNDVLDGTVTEYKNDRVIKTPYIDGKKEGIQSILDNQGNLLKETSYKTDEMNGFCKSYDNKGKLKDLYIAKNGMLNKDLNAKLKWLQTRDKWLDNIKSIRGKTPRDQATLNASQAKYFEKNILHKKLKPPKKPD